MKNSLVCLFHGLKSERLHSVLFYSSFTGLGAPSKAPLMSGAFVVLHKKFSLNQTKNCLCKILPWADRSVTVVLCGASDRAVSVLLEADDTSSLRWESLCSDCCVWLVAPLRRAGSGSLGTARADGRAQSAAKWGHDDSQGRASSTLSQLRKPDHRQNNVNVCSNNFRCLMKVLWHYVTLLVSYFIHAWVWHCRLLQS